MIKRRLLLRILVSPFIFAMIIVTYLYYGMRRFVLFMRYGGDFITHERDERKNIEDIYMLLRDRLLGEPEDEK